MLYPTPTLAARTLPCTAPAMAAVVALTAGLVVARTFALGFEWLYSVAGGVAWRAAVLAPSFLVVLLAFATLLGLARVELRSPEPAGAATLPESQAPRLWFVRWAPWSWALALAVSCNLGATLEWSYPYCNNPVDGEAWAAHGVPLPFMAFGGASSMEFDVMPTVYALDTFLIGAALLTVFRWVHRSLAPLRRVVHVVSSLGFVVLVLVASAQTLNASLAWIPVRTIAWNLEGHRYHQYRPVGVSSAYRCDCTQSAYWFGPVARHAQ